MLALATLVALRSEGSPRNARIRVAILGAMLVLTAANALVFTPRAHAAKQAQDEQTRAAAAEGTPEHAVATKQFGMLHGISMLLNLLVIAGAVAYLLLLSRAWNPE